MPSEGYFRFVLLITIPLLCGSSDHAQELNPTLGPNIRLGDDPPELPSDLRAQAEPHLARSFADTNLIVATFQEGRYPDAAAASCGYAVSTNGGLTWSRHLIPGLTRTSGGTWARASDPVAAVDLADAIYLNTLIVRTNLPQDALVVSKSTDFGQTFSQPIPVIPFEPDVDKEWLVINTFPNAPHANRIVETFKAFSDPVGYIHACHSDDGGASWSVPVNASGPDSYATQPVFLPDGSLVNFYVLNVNGVWRIERSMSADGGEHFGSPALVTSLSGDQAQYDDPIARDTIQASLSASSDRQHGVLYLTYAALFPANSSPVPRIMFTRSIDKGTSWSTPMPVNDTPGGQAVFNPCIAAAPDGQHVTIAFYDKRNQTADSAGNLVDFYLAESFDGGETWGPNIRLSEVSSDLRLAPLTPLGRMLGDYEGIVPALNFRSPGATVWIDIRNGNNDPYAIRIFRTQGTTFDTWRKLRFPAADLALASISGEAADPDGDGISNLAEYAFGLEPNHPDAAPVSATLSHRGNNSPVLNVTYDRLAVLGDIRFAWETSADLVHWSAAVQPGEDLVIPVPNDPTKERVSRAFSISGPVLFVRLAMSRGTP